MWFGKALSFRFCDAVLRVGEDVYNMTYNKLTEQEEYIIRHKGTERPWTGELLDNKSPGTYICRRCNAALDLRALRP